MAVHNVWSGALDFFDVFLFEREIGRLMYIFFLWVSSTLVGSAGRGFCFLLFLYFFYLPLFDGYFFPDFSFQLYGSVLMPVFF